MLVGPVFLAGSMTSERERETLDLLLTTTLTPWQILSGKFVVGFRISAVLTSFLLWPLLLGTALNMSFWSNWLAVVLMFLIVLMVCLVNAVDRAGLFAVHQKDVDRLAQHLHDAADSLRRSPGDRCFDADPWILTGKDCVSRMDRDHESIFRTLLDSSRCQSQSLTERTGQRGKHSRRGRLLPVQHAVDRRLKCRDVCQTSIATRLVRITVFQGSRSQLASLLSGSNGLQDRPACQRQRSTAVSARPSKWLMMEKPRWSGRMGLAPGFSPS